MFMDRYLEENKEQTMALRMKANFLKEELNNMQLQLNELLDFNKKGISTSELLLGTIEFLAMEKSQKSEIAIRLLNEFHKEVQLKIEGFPIFIL
jgi:hypothetical protein